MADYPEQTANKTERSDGKNASSEQGDHQRFGVDMAHRDTNKSLLQAKQDNVAGQKAMTYSVQGKTFSFNDIKTQDSVVVSFRDGDGVTWTKIDKSGLWETPDKQRKKLGNVSFQKDGVHSDGIDAIGLGNCVKDDFEKVRASDVTGKNFSRFLAAKLLLKMPYHSFVSVDFKTFSKDGTYIDKKTFLSNYKTIYSQKLEKLGMETDISDDNVIELGMREVIHDFDKIARSPKGITREDLKHYAENAAIETVANIAVKPKLQPEEKEQLYSVLLRLITKSVDPKDFVKRVNSLIALKLALHQSQRHVSISIDPAFTTIVPKGDPDGPTLARTMHLVDATDPGKPNTLAIQFEELDD